MSDVSFDRRALKIDGKRTLILSGTIHYPRSTPAMWPYLIRMARDAHLNTLDTYVFWNLHEPHRGRYDFSGRLDLIHWLRLAQDAGLHVVLRLGPYICAETSYGGFPTWLRDMPGIQMRTYNRPFLDEVERWLNHVHSMIKPFLAPNGGPIVLIQLENEYNIVSSIYGADAKRYLDWYVELAQSLNFGVPLIMCEGSTPGVIETINAFDATKRLKKQRELHPMQPALWTECWTGWYDVWGGPRHLRNAEDLAYSVSRFVAAGGALVNYYPFFGGTNFSRDPMFLQTAGYDFDAPLDEAGFSTVKYCQIARLNYFLRHYADIMMACDEPIVERHAPDVTSFTWRHKFDVVRFLCNDNAESITVEGHDQLRLIPPKSVSLFETNDNLSKEVMNTTQVAFSCASWRRTKSNSVEYLQPVWKQESPPDLVDDNPRAIMADKPADCLSLIATDTDYCWYSTSLDLGGQNDTQGELIIQGVGDIAHVFIDGAFVGRTPLPLPENRGPFTGDIFTLSLPLSLNGPRHRIDILTVSLGCVKGEWMLGGSNLVEERKGIWGDVLWKGEPLPGPWRISPGLRGERRMWYDDSRDFDKWREDEQRFLNQPLIWWKAFFSPGECSEPVYVDLSGMKKGTLWLNGRCLCRYWLIKAEPVSGWLDESPVKSHGIGEPTQRMYLLPFEWLRPDMNNLVLFEEIGGNPRNIRIIRKSWEKENCHRLRIGNDD